jgi:hypothetical protein
MRERPKLLKPGPLAHSFLAHVFHFRIGSPQMGAEERSSTRHNAESAFICG